MSGSKYAALGSSEDFPLLGSPTAPLPPRSPAPRSPPVRSPTPRTPMSSGSGRSPSDPSLLQFRLTPRTSSPSLGGRDYKYLGMSSEEIQRQSGLSSHVAPIRNSGSINVSYLRDLGRRVKRTLGLEIFNDLVDPTNPQIPLIDDLDVAFSFVFSDASLNSAAKEYYRERYGYVDAEIPEFIGDKIMSTIIVDIMHDRGMSDSPERAHEMFSYLNRNAKWKCMMQIFGLCDEVIGHGKGDDVVYKELKACADAFEALIGILYLRLKEIYGLSAVSLISEWITQIWDFDVIMDRHGQYDSLVCDIREKKEHRRLGALGEKLGEDKRLRIENIGTNRELRQAQLQLRETEERLRELDEKIAQANRDHETKIRELYGVGRDLRRQKQDLERVKREMEERGGYIELGKIYEEDKRHIAEIRDIVGKIDWSKTKAYGIENYAYHGSQFKYASAGITKTFNYYAGKLTEELDRRFERLSSQDKRELLESIGRESFIDYVSDMVVEQIRKLRGIPINLDFVDRVFFDNDNLRDILSQYRLDAH